MQKAKTIRQLPGDDASPAHDRVMRAYWLAPRASRSATIVVFERAGQAREAHVFERAGQAREAHVFERAGQAREGFPTSFATPREV